jgi:hypothetical protein
MTSRRLTAFIDAVAAGRRPKRLHVDPDDVDVLRAAITLRAARPGDAAPSEAFVAGLFQQLSAQAQPQAAQEIRPAATHRGRIVLVAAAAAAVLVAGTTFATESLRGPNGTSSAATQVPHGAVLRTGTFQTADGRILGQVVAYRGHPSWVFMNIAVPNYDGRIKCMLQVDDGSTVAFGTFTVHHGIGQFSKAIASVDFAHLRGARLVTAGGSAVASATFGA